MSNVEGSVHGATFVIRNSLFDIQHSVLAAAASRIGVCGGGDRLMDTTLKAEQALSESTADDEEKGYRRPAGVVGVVASVIALAFAFFHLYTGGVLPLVAFEQRAIHVTFALMLIFLLRPFKKGMGVSWVDVSLVIVTAICGIYLYMESDGLMDRMGIYTTLDMVAGAVLVLLVLEGTRRILGLAMPIIAVVFLLYGCFGYLAPQFIANKGYSVERIVGQMSLGTEGIFGVPLGVSATFVILFIIFASFLSECGAGQFFIDISMSLFGRFRGGPAKVSVMSSSLFGTVSGSAVANVMVDGWLTIPLMKKIGFKPHIAGAIEAVNSTGGQIVPPVMGAAAFIMAEILGTPYINICIAAAIPALLYYVANYFMIDFEAMKSGIRGLPASELPKAKEVLARGFFYLIPVVVLVYFLAGVMYTPMKSAIYAMISAIVVSWVRKSTRMNLKKVLKTLERGACSSLEVAMACACAGIIIGVFNLTGFGVRLSTILIDVAQGSLLALLVLTMCSSLILGMGLPTTACYIILAVLVAPAMVKMGVLPIAAHMFVFYFGILSAVTPPVAVAAYAGAGLAQAPPGKTGYAAWRLAIAGFILPYMFVYGPELLMVGRWYDIVLACITSSAGVFLLAASVQGYLLRKASVWERIVLFGSALLLIKPGIMTDILGLVGALLVFGVQIMNGRQKVGLPKPAHSPETD
jgi:TRAP transporter 4TM/12TM fusion protein